MTRQKKKIRYDDVSDFEPLTPEEWIKLPPDKQNEYVAKEQQIKDDANKKKELEDKLSATRERMTDAQKQLKEFGGDPYSKEHYIWLVKKGIMTQEEADKEYAIYLEKVKKGYIKNPPLKKIVLDCEKDLKRNEPITDADVIAEMNKKKIAGIEKRKITIERKNQEKLAEERERERRARMSPEEIEAENKKRLEEDNKEFERRGF